MEIRIKPLESSRFNISLVSKTGEIIKSDKNLDIHQLNETLELYREIVNSVTQHEDF